MPPSSFIFAPGNKLFDERQISSAMNNPITPNSIKLKYLKKRLFFFFFLPNKEYIYFVSWAMFITHKLFYAILKKRKRKKERKGNCDFT